MKRHLLTILAAIGSAALYVSLSRAAISWSGDLRPIPLWLATAGCIGVATIMPTVVLCRAVLFGGAVVGNLASGFLLFDETLRSIAAPALAVAVQSVLAVTLLIKVLTPDGAIRRTRRAIKVIGVSVFASAVGATIATIETASPVIDDRLDAWVAWALGDLVGLLVVLPLVVAHRVPLVVPREGRVAREMVISIGLVILAVAVTFNMSNSAVYLIAPAVLWLAIRFGPAVAAPASLFTVVVGTALTGSGRGPFLVSDHPVLNVQGFNLAVGLCALVGGGIAVRAYDDQQQLGALIAAMPDAAIVKRSGGEVVNAWIPQNLVSASRAFIGSIPPSDNPIDAIGPGTIEPTVHRTDDGSTFEQRIAQIADGRTLHLFRDITEDESRRRELHLRREELSAAVAEEQTRLGQLLHDGPIQLLTAALLRIGEQYDRSPSPSLAVAEGMIADAMHQLRSVSDQLVPPDVESGELVEALLHVGRRFNPSPAVTIDARDHAARCPTGASASAMYLIGREALVNVALHASAQRISIDLTGDDDQAVLEICDNGVGLLPVTDERRHLGLSLMRQRAAALGGSVEIGSGPDGGVLIRATLPVEPQASTSTA